MHEAKGNKEFGAIFLLQGYLDIWSTFWNEYVIKIVIDFFVPGIKRNKRFWLCESGLFSLDC